MGRRNGCNVSVVVCTFVGLFEDNVGEIVFAVGNDVIDVGNFVGTFVGDIVGVIIVLSVGVVIIVFTAGDLFTAGIDVTDVDVTVGYFVINVTWQICRNMCNGCW